MHVFAHLQRLARSACPFRPLRPFPIPISSTTAVPTGNSDLSALNGDEEGYQDVNLAFNPESFTTDGGAWTYNNEFEQPFTDTGVGHWTVAGVPEPALIVLAGIAVVAGLGACARRRTRASDRVQDTRTGVSPRVLRASGLGSGGRPIRRRR
jgi:hypothetical protein